MADETAAAPVDGNRVSTIELFFDLVFVFTITQVALIVEHHPSWTSAAQALLELVVIYWMYGGFAWLTNTVGVASPRRRVVLLLGMAAFLIVSLAVPRAFGSDGIAFGYAYLALTVMHLAGFLTGGVEAAARAMVRIGGANLVAAGLVLAAGYAGGPAPWPLWIAAIGLQWASPLVTGTTRSFEIDVAHFAERHGLMIIIVLGESLVSVALAAADLTVSFELVVGVLCGLAASAAMWWCYFARDDERAAQAYEAMRRRGRGPGPLFGYDVPHLLMLAGVVAVAAGSRLSLPRLTAPTTLAAATLLGGGAGLYLAAHALFRATLRFADPRGRIVTAAAMVAVIPLGTHVGAAQQLAVIAALIAVLLALEQLAEVRAKRSQAARGTPAQADPAG